MKPGLHVSIAGGWAEVGTRAKDGHCRSLQVFSRSPRGGKAKPIDPAQVNEMWTTLRAENISPLVVHVPYFINLASPEDDKHAFAVELLAEELQRAEALGAMGVVTHFGDHRGSGEEAGLRRVVAAVRGALSASPGKAMVLLENAAGEGGECGTRFEELAAAIALLEGDPRVGVCFDTAHAFAAGYDLRTPDAAVRLVGQVQALVGPERLRCFHLNDSKTPLGSRRDLHANIGHGEIGNACFEALCRHSAWAELPGILETPDKDPGARAADLALLAAWSAGR
ncbi:MAG: deoxyribonuclease IV [Chloroflexota bacterium]